MTPGIVMLDTRFRRFPGDIGCAESFTGDALFEVVPGATASRIVGVPDAAFLEPFIDAGRRLVARGATLVSTSCGFLVLYQQALAAALPVPVATSALLLLPALQASLPAGRRSGILTFSAARLGPAHLAAASAAPDTPIGGLPEGGVFHRAILEEEADGDSFEAREAEAVMAARALAGRHPELGAIVLECTNLPPHRRAIEAATGLPCRDVWDALAQAGGSGLERAA